MTKEQIGINIKVYSRHSRNSLNKDGYFLRFGHQKMELKNRMASRNYWLMKSEPDVFSIDDLKNAKNQTSMWEGVRNYEARNFMRDRMKVGDGVLYYHSNATPPGIVGIAEVCSEPYPDPTQFDPDSDYFDPKSTEDNPRWILIDVKYTSHFNKFLDRGILQANPILANMMLFKRNRLSITPVSSEEWEEIIKLSK